MTDETIYSESMEALRDRGYDYATAHEIASKRAQPAPDA